MAAPIIEATNLYKRYGEIEAVRGISYHVMPGEIFALLGPNGAGKTTTIRMTLGLIEPDRGRSCLFGEAVHEGHYRRIGYLPEERGLYEDVSVLESLVYFASLKGLSRREARTRALKGLERVGLADRAEKKVKDLSRGMQQKVQFLVATLHDPALIIIDEPFSGLDPVNTRLIKEMLYEMAAQGTAVVMSSHQMRQIEEMADRMMMVSQGKRVLYGTIDEVRRRYASGSVLVRASGNLERVSGVDRVIQHNGGYELIPKGGVTPQALLHQLTTAPDIEVEAFEIATPTLDEVFVQVVGKTQGQ